MGMTVLVCGGRDYTDAEAVRTRLAKFPKETAIIHGGARGADTLAGKAAKELGLRCIAYPADWNRYGKAAGIRRNETMLAAHPDLVVAFPGGKGTAHMVRIARSAGVVVDLV